MSETTAGPRPTLESILDLNALPWTLREQIYVRLCPEELLARFGVNRGTLLNGAGERTLRVAAPDEGSWARLDLREGCHDRDPVLVVDIAMSAFGVPELTFVQINDPAAPRYGVDRDADGQDTLLGTVSRNLDEEGRALGDGLGPGQVRRGLRMLGRVLECMDGFCRILGRDCYLVEPLFYHSALVYERHGCDYLMGRELMDEIHAGFQEGGPLHRLLDDSTPFRRRGFDATVRGRSWAIHDGILDAVATGGWSGVKMYRVPGRPAAVSTFPGGIY
ncbi:MAG TPA: hypothetical protein VK548_16100 [Candidatus Acidoferrum sp.]|nr:hypothetical protein [Candidatus Acidoferrum sp.]